MFLNGDWRGEARTDEVNTSQLLESLDSATSGETLAHGAAQDVEVGGLAETQLVLVVGLDLGQLLDDGRVVDVKTTETGKGLGGVLVLVLLDQETGGLGQDQHTDDQDDGPGELDSHGDTVGASIHAVLGGVVDDGGQQKTDGDGQLVGTDDGTTDPLGGSLGLVHGDGSGEQTNTQTGEETTSHEEGDGGGGNLKDDTDGEDDGVEDHGEATTEDVGHGGSEESTEEGTSREQGDNHGGLRGGHIRVVVRRIDVAG